MLLERLRMRKNSETGHLPSHSDDPRSLHRGLASHGQPQWRPDGDRLASLRELTAAACAAVIGLPLGAMLALFQFPCRRQAAILLSSLMGMPPVVPRPPLGSAPRGSIRAASGS